MKKRFDDDDDLIFPAARDGESIRVPVYLMDSMAGFRPGFVRVSDAYVAVRRAARDAYIRDLTSAWKDGGRVRHREPPDDEDNLRRERDRREYPRDARRFTAEAYDVADAARTASYLAMCQRLTDAWKQTPNRDWGQPDMGSRPEEQRREIRQIASRPDPNESLVRSGGNAPSPGDRERMYAQRNHDLENAWRMMGRTDPNKAGQIENQRERWLGK
jgi:hypothetical protein